jgi:DNA-binding transcriptional LysR family regulator
MTNAGQMMVDTAVRALRLIDESVGACRSQSQLREGRVVLAVGHLTAGALLPPLLGRFSQQHPTLATTLLDSTAEQMISRMLSQEADLGFGSDIGQKHSELATEPLFSERMALFVRDDHSSTKASSRLFLIDGSSHDDDQQQGAHASRPADSGRVTNTLQSPRDSSSARRRFSSIIGPRMKPSSSGAGSHPSLMNT